jgi:hypothetical protein
VVHVFQSTVKTDCSGKYACQQDNGSVPYLLAKLHCLQGTCYQVLELTSGTTAPANCHQSLSLSLSFTHTHTHISKKHGPSQFTGDCSPDIKILRPGTGMHCIFISNKCCSGILRLWRYAFKLPLPAAAHPCYDHVICRYIWANTYGRLLSSLNVAWRFSESTVLR